MAAMSDAAFDERQALHRFLHGQRDCVLSIVEGLDDEAWRTPIVPSGWTAAGLVQHLGDAEQHWFQNVMTGTSEELPYDEGRPPYDPAAPFTTDRPPADVLAYYREQCARSDAVIARTPLSAPPVGQHNDPDFDEDVPNLRWIVLHMIEETASHSGHLDIARELLDGRTNLGLR
jgi:uncharacterized damage-inducible protein DinB